MDQALSDRLDKLEKRMQTEFEEHAERNRDRFRDLQGLMESRLDGLERVVTKLVDRIDDLQPNGSGEENGGLSDLENRVAELQDGVENVLDHLKRLANQVSRLA